MIDADDLAMMQDAVSDLRATPCTISRYTSADDGAGGQTNTYVPLSNPPMCRVMAMPQIVAEKGAEGRLETVVRWTIALPPGQDVTAKDRIMALGVTYEVTDVLGPKSNEIERICQVEVIS